MIGVIVCAMLNNVHHLANLYMLITSEQGIYDAFKLWEVVQNTMAIVIVLMFDFAVLYKVINSEPETNDLFLAKVFAVIMVIVNLLFWNILKDIYDFSATIHNPVSMAKFITKIIFSVFSSFIIYEFSEHYKRLIEKQQKETAIQQAISNIQHQHSSYLAQHEQLMAHIQQLREKQQHIVSTQQQHNQQKETHNAIENELFIARKERDYYEAKWWIEQVQRTLYLPDTAPKMVDSVKALAGSITHLSPEQRAFHEEAQKRLIAKWKNVLDNNPVAV